MSLSGLPTTYSGFDVNVSSADVNGGTSIPTTIIMDVTTPDGVTNRISHEGSKANVLFMPIGSKVTASVSYDADAYPYVKGTTQQEQTFTVDNSEQVINFSFESIAKRTVTGTIVTGTGSDKKAVPFATVIISQPITRNDGSSYTLKTVAVSDENGKFTVPDAYAGYEGTVEIRATGYSVLEKSLASGTSTAALGEIALDYYGNYAIIPFLSKEPIILRGADGNFAKDDDGNVIGNEMGDKKLDSDASLLTVDTIKIGNTTYQRGTHWFESVNDGQSFITFRDLNILKTAAANGTAVTVNYKTPDNDILVVDGTNMKLRQTSASAKFDSANSLAAEVTAYDPTGEIRVTACDVNDDGYMGYAVLSDGMTDDDINVVAWAGGTGELSIPYEASSKSYKLYTFYVNQEDSNLISQLLKSGRPNMLDAVNTSAVKTTNITKLVENSIVTLGNKAPSRVYSDIGFGPFGFDYIIHPYDEDMNYAELRGIITKRDTSNRDKDVLYSVTLSGTDSESALVVNGESPADDGVWYNISTGKDKYRNVISAPVYALIPYKSDTNTVDFNISLAYKDNGADKLFTDSLSITEDVRNFDISVPEDVNILDELKKAGWKEGSNFDNYAWALDVNITAYKGDDRENVITIWDNGAAIGTVNAAELNGATIRSFNLTHMYDAGTHTMWATRERKAGSGYETISTPKYIVSLNANVKDIYAGNMAWYHNGKLQGKTVSVNPNKPSIFVFTIYGATSSDIEDVKFYAENSNGGVNHIYNAKLLYDSPSDKTSRWIVAGNEDIGTSTNYARLSETKGVYTGTSTQFSVSVNSVLPAKIETSDRETLREQALREYYDILGVDVPDFNNVYDKAEDWENYTTEQRQEFYDDVKASVPAQLAAVHYNLDVSADGKTYTYTATPTADIFESKLVMNYGDNKEYLLSDIYAQMDNEREGQITEDDGYEIHWSTIDTAQGRMIERMAVKNEKYGKGYRLNMHQTVYAPSEAVDALYEAAGADSKLYSYSLDEDAPLSVFSADDAPLQAFAAKKNVKAKTNSSGDPIVKKVYDGGNYIYSAVDIYESALKTNAIVAAQAAGESADVIKEAAKNAGFMPEVAGKVANGLSVLDTVYTIAKGPAGENGDNLWKMLMLVKDKSARQSLSRDLQDYLDLRKSSYVMDCTVKVATCGAGFWDPSPESVAAKGAFAVKVGLFAGGLAYDKIRDNANDYQADTYRTIEHDIIERIRFEEERVKHAEEVKAAKARIENNLKRLKGYVTPKMLEEELQYYVLTRKNGKLTYVLRSKLPKVNVYIDPSGYVFEAVEDNRVSGITATLYKADENGEFAEEWADPNDEAPQANPQITVAGEGDIGGRYGWMVPEGDWKIRFYDENENYRTAETNIIQVPPEHTNVNIGLMSTETPTVKMETKNGKIVLSFSKYMKMDSLVSAGASQTITYNAAGTKTGTKDTSTSYDDESFDYTKFAISFYGANGRQIKGTVSFPDKEANTGYTSDLPYQTDWIYSDYFVKTAVFTPTDGSSVTGATMQIGEGIESYSGIALPADTEVIDTGALTVTRTDKGKYTASLNTGEKCVIIATSYDNAGNIYAVATAYASNGTTDVEVDVPFAGANVIVRAWDSLSNMKALSDPVQTTG